ncbi:MAG: hypothetical protein KJ749_04375 [Planctomycetes bacterium]|nr:hypothetical protein [Planctomycetota bacterium]
MLIKVAGEVSPSALRILVEIPAYWPHLSWFQRVCDAETYSHSATHQE